MRDELAGLCRKLVVRLEELLDNPGYNLLLHQAPFSMSEKDHWYLELLPRLTRAAGYEWGTDIWINPVAPETAAKQIRIDA
jgi:UDPglucose--hexose-1-phosphate uridylyltransferase